MPKHGKKYRSAVEAVPSNGALAPREALECVQKAAFANFDETVEAAVRLGVDPRKADQIVRGTVILPAGTGRKVRVLALVKADRAAEAEEAGADYVGTDYIEQIQEGWLEFDVAIATPDLMKDVARLGRILGPRGLMPTPKAGTVTMDVSRAVRESKAGKIEFRVDRTGNVHAPIGKVSFELDQLNENLDALMDEIVRLKPAAAKGRYVKSVTVTSTMGLGVSVDEDLYR
ncbi:50S ribosomal protein L1 [Candidatus Palauibacter polyketidifaciens]|uniref:50S ribosomal protein L1 n=1 Tax=Candidatus Palauibacter polyketidifaciens TaxID=3056740 RepID=UPI002391C278|nr:50S ribosomal protein L1 [Candidatus Palauibacter polyketidifaciens]MDE2720054.1 50S ribosomal protein L1 [Candidatus Palauibacter polyketidifaciens]